MKKTFILSTLAAVCCCLTARAQDPVVTTDKDDYAPGETVQIMASNFQPLELLDFSIAVFDDNGFWKPDAAWGQIPADSSGSANASYVVPQTWAGKNLQLTAMGLTSGLMAQTTFTDNPGGSITASAFSIGHVVNTVNVSVNLTSSNIASLDSAVMHVSSSAGAGDNRTVTLTGPGGNGKGTWTGSFTGLCGTTYTIGNAQVDTSGTGGHNHPLTSTPGGTVATTTDACPPVNSPPDITCLNPTAELGQKVGCLVNGVLQADFSVSYGVVAGPGNTQIVQATFTTPGGPVTVDVANVADPDAGDTISVTLANGTNPVTISGPGSGSASFSVDIHADDGSGQSNATDDETCGGTANAQIIYAFSGFFPPLDGQINTKVKRGSGVPVKFRLMDGCGNLITTGDHTIDVSWLSGAVPGGDPTVDDAGLSGDAGDNFRYDPTGQQWIFNLKTNSTYIVSDTYQITAHLDDGTDHNVSIAIK
jgi:hypothetical protein